MIEITADIRAWIDHHARDMELAGDEYIDPADGLIHCKKCGGNRQTVVPNFGKSGYFMPRCVCPCQAEVERRRKEDEEQRNRMESVKRRRAQGLQDRYLYDYTFANDNGQNPLMKKARAYVEHWDEAYRHNTGLLLFGDVGTGKSFFAGCIANALLDRDIPVLMTNFPSILNRLTGMFSEDRAEFIASPEMYDLLIIDDLGVERSTEYAMEQMFTVIDGRYRSRRPMIITTNLKLEMDRLDKYPAATGGASGKGVYAPMSNEKMPHNTTAAPAPEDRPALVKKIGKTTYKVRVHFSTTSTETMSDKIKRMLKNEVQQM